MHSHLRVTDRDGHPGRVPRDDLLGPAVFARLTGLSLDQLRRFDRRAYLLPHEVDPRTGHRAYARRQVQDGRLLAGLLGLGMPVPEAAKAVAEQDGQAVRAHLDAVDAALTAVRDTMPPVHGRHLRRRSTLGEDVVTEVSPTAASPDALTAVLAARAALARAVGREVADLPASTEREGGFPDGAVVPLDVPFGSVKPLASPPALTRVLLPWPPVRGAPPEGFTWAELPRGDWVLTDLAQEERGADPRVAGGVVSEVAGVLDAAGPHLWRMVAVAYDHEVRTGTVALACRPF